MTKFTRTIATTTYTCKVYNKNTDALETASFIAEGKPVEGRALTKLIENESCFEEQGLQYLHVIETYTTMAKYECTLSDFLSVAHKVEKADNRAESE